MWPSGGTQKLDIATNQSMNGDFNSNDMEVVGFDILAVQAVWTSSSNTKGKIVPQASLDRVNWCNLVPLSDAKIVDNTGGGCLMYNFSGVGFDWFRIEFVANGNSSGAVTVTVRAKKS